jgi:PAS domain S-box-containing protein
MTPAKLLQRQLRQHWGADTPEALATCLQSLEAVASQPDTPAPARQALTGLRRLLEQVDGVYQQMERDLMLSQRSLALSSSELNEVNQRLRNESSQMQRATSSLLQTLNQLTQGLEDVTVAVDSPPGSDAANTLDEPAQGDLAGIAQRMAQLVRAHAIARQQLHASEQRLLLAVQGSNMGLWDWNLQTHHVHFSDEWAAMLGYAVSDLAPHYTSLIGLLHPDEALRFGNEIGAYFDAHRTDTFRTEVQLRCKDGAYKWVAFTGRVVEYDAHDEPVRATGVSMDISAHKAYEQAMAAARDAAQATSRAKGDFLANMSHEIRTPMNGILGLTELCLATELNTEQRGYIEMVHTSARSLLTVINDILDFSKIEANKLDIEHLPFNLSQVIRHTLAPLKLRAGGRDIPLHTELAPSLPEWVAGDADRLRQVLLNLVGNAVKFTDSGHVTLGVEVLSATPSTHALLRFSVQDTGIGIAPDRLASVFDAFSQADTSISRRFGGTGLGLTISSRLVRLMGGQLQVSSQLGEGTRFWFDLELALAQAPAPDLSPASEKLPHGLRVLVAEDHPINQVVSRKILEHLGQQVTLVSNGELAVAAFVEQAADQPFDLVFMDIQMPVLDGFAAARRLREHEAPLGRHTPIVAMTAHAMEGYREQCLAGGMDGYVTKPVERRQLVQEMRRVLRLAVD